MNTPNCSEILNLIPSYIDDMLDNIEKDRVAEHIKSCPACSAELKLMKSVTKETANLPDVKISDDFHSKLMAKTKGQSATKRARRIVLLRRSGAGVAAAAVVALSVVSFSNLNRADTDITEQTPVYSAAPTPEVTPTPEASPDVITKTTSDANNHTEVTTPPQSETEEIQPVQNLSQGRTDSAVPAGGGSSAQSPVPEASAPVDTAAVCDESAYMVAEITLDDSNREAVMAVLSPYEKDHIGYKVPDIGAVLRKIAELGIQVQAKDCDMASNYIIVK